MFSYKQQSDTSLSGAKGESNANNKDTKKIKTRYLDRKTAEIENLRKDKYFFYHLSTANQCVLLFFCIGNSRWFFHDSEQTAQNGKWRKDKISDHFFNGSSSRSKFPIHIQ